MVSSCARVPVAAVRYWLHVVPRDVIASPSKDLLGARAPGCGFAPAYRLHTPAEFSAVFSYRRVVRGRVFNLHYRPSESGARLGVVVAKKLARHAVLRNLIKRLTREAFRLRRAHLPSLDVVVRLSASPKQLTRRALRGEIGALFERLPRG